jgi:hypothetical protein
MQDIITNSLPFKLKLTVFRLLQTLIGAPYVEGLLTDIATRCEEIIEGGEMQANEVRGHVSHRFSALWRHFSRSIRSFPFSRRV